MLCQHKVIISTVLAGLLVLLLIFSGVSFAQGSYAIPWWTVDDGGSYSVGGNFAVTGTVGQPDAGRMGNGEFTVVNGGFWHGAGGVLPPPPPPGSNLYLPVIIHE